MPEEEKVQAPKKYRLVVRSAEEAVRLIREKLGDQARVTSVRQVGGEGLKRFISSPKLEVIAEVGTVVESDQQDSTENQSSDLEENAQGKIPKLNDSPSPSIESNEMAKTETEVDDLGDCLLYTSPSPRDQRGSRMPSSA